MALPVGNATEVPGPCSVTVHFDGACGSKLGAGGVVIRHLGRVVCALAMYFGDKAKTCNEAEMKSLVTALMKLKELNLTKRGEVINIFGDSKLIISFMNRLFTPGKKEFAAQVEQCRRIARTING